MHTIVLSDFHLADAEIPPPENPLWKRFKHPELFVDASFERFLEDIQGRVKQIRAQIEDLKDTLPELGQIVVLRGEARARKFGSPKRR